MVYTYIESSEYNLYKSENKSDDIEDSWGNKQWKSCFEFVIILYYSIVLHDQFIRCFCDLHMFAFLQIESERNVKNHIYKL